MAHQSPKRTDPPSSGPRYRHRRYRVLGTLPALLLLAAGAYLGLALGNWILLDGAALYLLITVAMIATDTSPRRPPAAPSPTPPNTLVADATDATDATDGVDKAPTRVPVAAASRSGARPANGAPGEPTTL
jgi:hypothetical protein